MDCMRESQRIQGRNLDYKQHSSSFRPTESVVGRQLLVGGLLAGIGADGLAKEEDWERAGDAATVGVGNFEMRR